jgi:acetoacetyl-CoA synthetase
MTSDADQDRGDRASSEGSLLWQPSAERIGGSNLHAYMRWLGARGVATASYDELWSWSVDDSNAFWLSIWDYFQVITDTPPAVALADASMPFARFFPGTTLNYAEHALRYRDRGVAVIARTEDGHRTAVTYEELADRVARAREGLRRLGVVRGDRVAAILPNSIEALVAFLATASLGAIWSSCSPEFGSASVLDRFRQIEPKVLFAVDGYRYGGKSFDRSAELSEVVRALPSLERTVVVSELGTTRLQVPNSMSFDELTHRHAPLEFDRVPFDHPLWILYSSGTTGLPKPIVHGHGGILLEHYKALALHCDLQRKDRFFWFTTTGWMMWNFLISGLLLGSTLVLYDGSPAWPDLTALWQLASDEGVTYFGTSSPFLIACQKAGIAPKDRAPLERLRAIGTTGSPLPADGFAWVYSAVGRDLLLGSVSGGTDVCTAFVLSCPLLPVHAGEIQCRGLGARVEAFDEHGHSMVGAVGELVLTAPLPSMPVSFWGDESGARYRESYFDQYPGVWRHGDWIKITERGSAVIYGRSDSTLNRGGVRMGTSEFYRVVEAHSAVADSLVIDTASLEDATGKMWLFVVPRRGARLDAAAIDEIKAAVRRQLSPRHVPDEVVSVSAIPRTLSGKKIEVPIKRLLSGTPAERAVNRGTLHNPAALDDFIALAARLQGENPSAAR